MAVKYKQKCYRCKKNYVVTTYRERYVLCYECQKKELSQEIKHPKFKKLFDIPEEFYEKSYFLRNIKLNYLRYESLTDKQIEAFKKTVEEMKKEKEN